MALDRPPMSLLLLPACLRFLLVRCCRMSLQRLALIALHPVRYLGCILVVRFTRPPKVQRISGTLLCRPLTTAHLDSAHYQQRVARPSSSTRVVYFLSYAPGYTSLHSNHLTR